MKRPIYPFCAIVGQEALKKALLLCAIDSRLGVLLRGDKGAGKSTAARSLATLLGIDAPFIDLPVGASEDRVLGGLDIQTVVNGRPSLKRGLLAKANGGVLYIDEVNLLPDHLINGLLDAAASGAHVLERDGFSEVEQSQFVLVGSMNPEEGALRPQLLDRFALSVDVSAPMTPELRRAAVERRLAFDAAPGDFEHTWRSEEEQLRERVQQARTLLPRVMCPSSVIEEIATIVVQRRVRSLRADIAIVRASRALAALRGALSVDSEDIELAANFALAHRARNPATSADESRQSAGKQSPEPTSDAGLPPRDRVFDVRTTDAPSLLADTRRPAPGQHAAFDVSRNEGNLIRFRHSAMPEALELRASVVHALMHTGRAVLREQDLQEKVRKPHEGRRFLFVVDASGSQAMQRRMEFSKGAVLGLLEASFKHRDEVALVAFRATTANVVVRPTRDIEEAHAAIQYMPTGGRTPLATAFEVARELVTEHTILILVTDGKANVPIHSGDAWQDALSSAAAMQCPALVIDSEIESGNSGRARELASALGATYVRLDDIEHAAQVRLSEKQRADVAN